MKRKKYKKERVEITKEKMERKIGRHSICVRLINLLTQHFVNRYCVRRVNFN